MSSPKLHLDADTSMKALHTTLISRGYDVTRTPNDWMPMSASDEAQMIPEFDESGNLPPRIHWTEWEEFKERFGTTRKRLFLMEGLQEALEQLQASGCRTIYINGSFVTSKPNPNDFDTCWEPEGVDIDYLRTNAPALLDTRDKRMAQKNRYKGEFFSSEWIASDTGITYLDIFQVDRKQNRKGIIAIDLMRWQK